MIKTSERKEGEKGAGMTRVNMVHYVVINSRAPSLDSRIYYNKFDFDHDCMRVCLTREEEKGNKQGAREGRKKLPLNRARTGHARIFRGSGSKILTVSYRQ